MLRRLIMWSELLKKERSMLVKICLHWKKEYSKFFQPNCRSFVRQLGCERGVAVTGTIWDGLIFSRRKMLTMLGECEFCSKFLFSNKDQIKWWWSSEWTFEISNCSISDENKARNSRVLDRKYPKKFSKEIWFIFNLFANCNVSPFSVDRTQTRRIPCPTQRQPVCLWTKSTPLPLLSLQLIPKSDLCLS